MILSILFILMAKRITVIETEMRLTICNSLTQFTG